MQNGRAKSLSVREMAAFAMLGVLMYVAKRVMEPLPNIHPLALLTVTYTLVFRARALYPIYVYVFVNGFFEGFATWWLPYLYLWAILWGVAMLLPRHMTRKKAAVICPIVCALHGLAFGTLYAPGQALLYGYDLEMTLSWIVAGLPWDAVHAAGNFAMGLLTVPLTLTLTKLAKRSQIPCFEPIEN